MVQVLSFVIALWVESNSEGLPSFVHLYLFDRLRCCMVAALSQLNGSSRGLINSHHLWGARCCPFPFNVVPKALPEV